MFLGTLGVEWALVQASCLWFSDDILSGSMVCRARSPFPMLCIAVALIVTICPLTLPSLDSLRSSWCTPYQCFFLVAAIVHACSMFSTSFVEEEHQTVYCIVSCLHLLQLLLALRNEPSMAWPPLIFLVCARVLRSYNQVCNPARVVSFRFLV